MLCYELTVHTHHPRARLGTITFLATATLAALVTVRPGDSLTDGESLATFVAWLVAVAASGWLTLSSAACLAATVTRRPAPRLAPLALRRLVEIALVTGAVTLPALPAHAAGPPSSPRDQPIVRAAGALARPAPSTLATLPPASLPTARVAPRSTPQPTVPTPPTPRSTPLPKLAPVRSRTHVVEPGENLWSIARGALAPAGSHQPNDAQLIAYWHAVIASNRASLRSGNPSLIFPGEIVTLPPFPSLP